MRSASADNGTLVALGFARDVANYAQALGVKRSNRVQRNVTEHLGAALADTVLQAGVNYRTVVQPRIDRIIHEFPETSKLSGTIKVVERNSVSNFLLWKHSEKIGRFIRLVEVLNERRVDTVQDLQQWLRASDCRQALLNISGIGPKSVDYLACLLGADCVAVDRHVKTFVSSIGIDIVDYDVLKLVISYAADLLEMPRREFDFWIWNLMSVKSVP